ncbi:MAG: outer membrane beta-barrel protein [Paludibacter sp.]|nr:outer membrane beta-barrel protein [Paludibacter sp.]
MKSVLKIRLIILLLAVVCSLNAQTYRLELGVNNPQRYGNVTGLINYFDGIKLGGTAEYKLKNNFSLLTGALYNFVYSNNFQGNPNSVGVTYTTTGHFLDIPLRLTYTYPLNKNLKIFGFAGPNLNIGLFQNMKITSTQTYDSSNPFYVQPRSVDLYNGSDPVYQLNRLNLQIGLGGGVQWKKYQLKAGYDFGLNNLNKLSSGNLNQKGWYISVAYQF